MVPVVVVPVLNTYEQLKRCVASFDFPVGDLLVINNGSGVVDVPDRAERTHVIQSPSNLGVGPSWNLGIKMFPWSEGWLFLNSDAWFEPGAMAEFWGRCRRDSITLAGVPGWCCAWVGDGVVARIGLFSECYLPAYYEDVDFEARARAADIFAEHTGCMVNHDNASSVLGDPVLAPLHHGRVMVNRALHDQRWAQGVPAVGEWSLESRRRLGWEVG